MIPAEVESIEPYAFDGCTTLADVYYGGTVAEWNSLKDNGKINSTGNDALFNATIHCSDGIVTAAANAAELIASLESGEYNIAVTGAITGETISAIKTALQSNKNAKVSLDLSQTTGLTSIGKSALSYCSNLTTVTIPNGVISIANFTFNGCGSLTSVNIPDSVTSIGNAAFSDCKSLTIINIPNSVTSIGEDAFRYCSNLTTIAIPDSVDSIGEMVFRSCTNLTELTVSEGNKTYESYENCIYTKAEKTLIAVATGLTNIMIPDGATSIGKFAFHSCGNLTSVTIPKSVTKVEFGAFYYCEKLKTVVYDGKKSEWEAISINDELGGSGLNANIALTIATIHCTDGDINGE